MENKKINIAELLKDSPKGTKLYSPLCGECRVIKVYNHLGFDVINGNDDVFSFSYDGRYNLMGECCIFPSKDQRDWSKFVPPCKFKDGDVVVDNYGATFLYKQIHTYYEEPYADFYCGLTSRLRHLIIKTNEYQRCGKISYSRLATEEEKKKLFDAIKKNGYKWNEETKTLEKLRLTQSKFDITTLMPFDKVLMRSSNAREWVGTIYSHYNNNYFFGCGMMCQQCIPYEKNEHLLGTTDDCDDYFKNWND